jgi:hypothetical protein
MGGSKGSDPPISICQRTEALLRGMVLILEHHDAPSHVLAGLEVQVHSYLDSTDNESVWLQRCKHLLTYPLAKYLKNEPPPKPDICFSPSGKLRSWMKPRLNGFSLTNTHLWYSWFQTKRCTLPLSEGVVELSYEKHLATLTQEDPGDIDTINNIFNDRTFQYVMELARKRFMDSYLSGPSFETLDAKFSASFEYSRKNGGQQNALREIVGLQNYNVFEFEDYDEYKKGYNKILGTVQTDEMSRMVYKPWVYTRNGREQNYHATVTRSYGESEWLQLPSKQKKGEDGSLKYKKDASENDSDRKLNCAIQAVLEPNKIRIISKGEALPYYSSKPMQKALFAALKDINCFKLISKPISVLDIFPLVEKSTQEDKWFSVDYSAATDGLSWKYSGRIFRYLIGLLPEKEQKEALDVLGPHNLYYPTKLGRVFKGVMTNGQLMGSILSFPILCLANLGVYLLATQRDHEEWSDQERIDHVLINGDDMIYSANESLWNDHVRIGRNVGLEMSVGKAYQHREYLNINSTSFHCPLHVNAERSALRVTQIGYLNTGLFFGQHKVQGKHGDQPLAQAHDNSSKGDGIVENINCLLSGSRPGRQIDLLKKVLMVQKEKITEECKILTRQGKVFHRNLFIPLALGGMGVSAPSGFKFRLSKQEIYVAHGLIRDLPECLYTSQLPLPGYPLEDKIELEDNCPWTPKDGGDEVEKPRVPLFPISLKTVKHFCRTGFYRYVPFKGCSEAPSMGKKQFTVSFKPTDDDELPSEVIISVKEFPKGLLSSQTTLREEDPRGVDGWSYKDIRSYFQ